MQMLPHNIPLTPASFVGSGRNKPQVQLVINLIKRKIKDEQPIQSEDIIDTYTYWRINHSRSKLTLSTFIPPSWRIVEYSAEDFKKQHSVKALSLQWFKNNLASAIIDGKLLVIPIIDIEK
jgi:hypothetical protein